LNPGHRHAGLADQVEEEALELGERLGGRRGVVGEQSPQSAHPPPAVAALEQAEDRADVEPPQPRGLLVSALEPARVQHLGEVEQRARNRGERNSVPALAVFEINSGAMKGEAGPACEADAGVHADVDRPVTDRSDAPQRRGVSMAEQGPAADREHGGHPLAAHREVPVADRVDPAVKGMKTACSDPHPHGARRKAERAELAKRNHAMLPLRELRDLPIHGGLVDFRQRY
jgi:hypothetical protein